MLSSGGTFDEVKCEDLVKVTIGDDPEKFFQVGSQLPQQEREIGRASCRERVCR